MEIQSFNVRSDPVFLRNDESNSSYHRALLFDIVLLMMLYIHFKTLQ